MTDELDFYDATLQDSLAVIPSDQRPSAIYRRKVEELEALRYGEYETMFGEGYGRMVGLENQRYDQGEYLGEGEEEKVLIPPDESTIPPTEVVTVEESVEEESRPTSFTPSIWSSSSSKSAKTDNSFELPKGPIAWNDEDSPVEQILNYADLTLTPEEMDGLLTDRIVAACSSYLARCPETTGRITAKVNLNSKGLSDIRILAYHRFLQYIDLSWNNLNDLTPLGEVPYLMYLDVSHNILTSVLQFKAPWNLTYVNYSYNEVFHIDDLSEFWSLSYLDLSHNHIDKIQGLSELRYLRHLDLSHNKIIRFENLNDMKITDLNLEYNLVCEFEMGDSVGVKTLLELTNLHLNNNCIRHLNWCQGVYRLRRLELQENEIHNIEEIRYLKTMKLLRSIDLTNSPITQCKSYREFLIRTLPELKYLDKTEIEISERVSGNNMVSFDVRLQGARTHARLLLLEQLNNPSIELDILPVDQGTYPLVLLVGPPASSKKVIVTALYDKYPDKIHIGQIHTTRIPIENEVESRTLIHVPRETFNEMVKTGQFLAVTEIVGHYYGFHKQQLASAVQEHKLCLTFMDMEGAICLHSHGIRPFLVLCIPKSQEDHKKYLREKYGPLFAVPGSVIIGEREYVDGHACTVNITREILEEMIVDAMMMSEERQDWRMSLLNESGTGSLTEKGISVGGGSSVQYSIVSRDTRSSTAPSYTSDYSFDRRWSKDRSTISSINSPVIYDSVGTSSTSEEYRSSRLESSSEELTETEASKITSEDTSYSDLGMPIGGPFYHYYGESVAGELTHDTFEYWSSPFVDWDEILKDAKTVKEAANQLCQIYTDTVLCTRDIYHSIHLENAGLFSLCVYTDCRKSAVKKISKFIKEMWKTTPTRRAMFDLENDSVYQAMIPKRLEEFKKMMELDRTRVSDDKSWSVSANRLRTPQTIVSDIEKNNLP